MSDQEPLYVILELLKALQEGQSALQEKQSALQEGQISLGGRLDKFRVDLMARMDRLQDTATKQGQDLDTLLDLMASNQHIAETATTTARASTDIGAANSLALTKLLQRQRTLEAELQAIKDRLNGGQSP